MVTLGVTETISWGVLYYAFTVYLAPMEAELGWSRGDMTGAFSLAVLLAGLAAIPVGRWLDRHGPRLLMTVGSVAATLLVLAWSKVANLPQLYLIWAAIGLVMSATLYDPAFATASRWFERQRVRALTVITLMAGFASTIFIPLAGWLVQSEGWRTSLVILAAILAVGTIAPHAVLLRRSTPGVLLFVLLFGAQRGLSTLARPALLADLYGAAQFASIAGVLQFLLSLAQAAAPFGAGVAYDALHSYEPVLWALTLIS